MKSLFSKRKQSKNFFLPGSSSGYGSGSVGGEGSSELSSHEPMSEADDRSENRGSLDDADSTSSPSQEPVYNIPAPVWNGSILWKVPFNGRGLAEKRFVRIKRAPRSGLHATPIRVISRNHSENVISYIVSPPTIVWSNPEKPDDIHNAREVVLSGNFRLVEGYESRAFLKSIDSSKPSLFPSFLLFPYLFSSHLISDRASSPSGATLLLNHHRITHR
jgi:hypothetical protein